VEREVTACAIAALAEISAYPKPDVNARSCRIADVATWHNYALLRIYLTETITGSALVL
jgi:hypothetical protein